MVARAAGRRLPRRIAQMVAQLTRQRRVDHTASQLRQQAALAGDLLGRKALQGVLQRVRRQQASQTVLQLLGRLGATLSFLGAAAPPSRLLGHLLHDDGSFPGRARVRMSGSRGGCPPRLPQNRACAVHTRLLGTAGYEPRRRPLSTTSIYPHSIASCPWVGATISSCQSRCSITSESSPRSVKNRVRRALSTCGIWLSAHRDLRPA